MSRSKEVWQYIDNINTAASSFIWDNVYSYDITFRRLMEFNPHRSWAVTYTKMWNLCTKQPTANFAGNKVGNNNRGIPQTTAQGQYVKRKPDYC